MITFFTSEPNETRAWTVKKNTSAPKAAGKIHSDFEKGFIRAETISYDDFVHFKGEAGCREAGRLRQEGKDYMDQHHFIRYSSDDNCDDPLCINYFAFKVEYLQDGFADVEYFEASERLRHKKTRNLSFNIGAAHRLAEPYGYDPLSEWVLDNGNVHYTYLALQEGYNVNVQSSEYYNPNGELVATSAEVWEAVVIPEVLSDYSEKKRNELSKVIQHSVVVGFDYYKYNKKLYRRRPMV